MGEIHKEGTGVAYSPSLSSRPLCFLSPLSSLSLSWCCCLRLLCVCPSPLPTLFYSVGSPLLSPKPNTTTPPSSPHPLSLRLLAAFPTQSDRRAASSPPGRAIPRRFRAIRRGFGAPPGVSRRIGGDRDFPAGGQAPPPPPLRSLTLAASCPAAWGRGFARLLPAPPCALGAMNRRVNFCFYIQLGAGWGGGERFRDRGAFCCVSLPDVRSGLPRGASRLRVLLVVN